MASRKPLILLSGVSAELPPGDTVVGAQAGILTAGSGLTGGGDLSTNQRVDLSLAAAPSGLIFVGNQLGLDGAAQRAAETAQASGNAALSSAATAQASGNAALVSAAIAQASGNAALTSAAAKLPLVGGVLTGDLILDNQSDLRFREATAGGTNYVGFQAPSSVSSDLLWTLPGNDGSSGQVLQTNGAGALSWLTPGGGKVLQCQSYEITSYSSTSSASLQPSVVTGLITPTRATSRVLIIASFISTILGPNGMQISLYRDDATNLAAGSAFTVPWLGISSWGSFPSVVLHLDSPNTTSQTRYRVYFRPENGTGYINFQPQWYGAPSATITLLEIAP